MFKTLCAVHLGTPEKERNEVASNSPAMVGKGELFSIDVNFSWATALMQSHRKSSASLIDNGSLTPALFGALLPHFKGSIKDFENTQGQEGRIELLRWMEMRKHGF